MAPTLEVNPPNVRAGAGKIAVAASEVGKITVPAPGAAAAGLSGFATGGALFGAYGAVLDSLKVMGGRFQEMADVIRGAADAYEHADNPTANPSLSDRVGRQLWSLGDLNPAT